MTIQRDLRHAKRETMERLAALRDEAKLQLHLLSLDARQSWSVLETEIAALEARANQGGDKVSEATERAAHQLAARLREVMANRFNHSTGLSTNVRSLMSAAVHACRRGDSLSRAAQLMWENDCGAVPIVGDDGVVGLITDRDICMATYTQGKAPSELVVDNAMSSSLFSCGPDDSIGDVLAMMRDRRVRRAPVVGANGTLLGIVAIADVVRWAHATNNPAVDDAVLEALAAISSPHLDLSAAAE
jgi:CBS domain-containing protein